jgi:hypothetical protein
MRSAVVVITPPLTWKYFIGGIKVPEAFSQHIRVRFLQLGDVTAYGILAFALKTLVDIVPLKF